MHALSPALLVAGWVDHAIHPEDWPGIAANLLQDGFDVAALRRLAAEDDLARRDDAEPFVARLFSELSVTYPISEREAKKILTAQMAREVIAGKRNPWSTASYLERVLWPSWGDASEMDPLVQIFDVHEQLGYEPRFRPTIDELSNSVVKLFAELAMTDV